jgi:uncharacterized protein (DUF2252 family)
MVAALGAVLVASVPAQRALRPFPEALAAAPPSLLDRVRADPFTYFRFINRAWTARVCELFADVTQPTMVRLHGDAHVEQYALTKDAWGLTDFDDSTRGPAFVDIVRFLGSVDLAASQRGWMTERDALWTRFFEGYRRGLSDPDYQPPEPAIVGLLRQEMPKSRTDYLVWGEKQMEPMDEATLKSVGTGMVVLDELIRRERPHLAPAYFTVVRAGWLRLGVGSAATRKVLIRVQGPTADPADDELLEAKEVSNLDGVRCLDRPTGAPAVRVIDGTRQIGRIKYEILAVGPTLLIPAAADRAEHWLNWWVGSWEPSYREVRLSDLRSVEDLGDIVYDSGVQLGANKIMSVRREALSSVETLEARLRKETSTLIAELLEGWRELRER